MRLICLMALMFFIYPVSAQKNTPTSVEPTIKISMFKNLVPYSFVDDSGKAQGFLVDYWRLWARKVNRNIEFIPLSFSESTAAFRQNKVQMHAGLFKRETSLGSVNLLAPFYTTTAHIYVRKNDQDKIDQISDLKGKKIGVLGGGSYDSYIQLHFPLIKIKRFQELSSLIKAMDDQVIDAFINESVHTWFKMIKNLNYHQYEKISDFYLTKKIHAVVAKDDLALQSLVKIGMALISVNEVTELENTWIVNEDLRTSTLSKSERRWLKNNPNVAIASSFNWYPFIFISPNGTPAGYNVDLLALINKNLGTHFQLKRYKLWQEGLNDLIDGQVGGIFSLSWTKQRAISLNYSPPYFFDPHKIITKADNQQVKHFDDLKDLTIAVIKEYAMVELLKTQLPDAKLVYVKDAEQAFVAMIKNEADVTFLGASKPQLLAQYNLKIAGSFFSKFGQYAIGSSKQHPELSAILAKGINSITPQQHQQLLKKWHNKSTTNDSLFTTAELQYIKENPIVNVGTEVWQPIIFSDGKEIYGIIGDYLQQITKISGLTFKPIIKPWAQLLTDFEQQQVDLLPATYFVDTRNKIGLYGDSFLNVNSAIYTLNSNKLINSFTDLHGKKLAIVAGDATATFVKEKYSDIHIVPAADVSASITLLLNGKVDAIFSAEVITSYILKNSAINNIKLIKQNDIHARGLYFWSQKNKPLLQSILNKSMKSIPQKFKNQAVERWIGRSEHKKSIRLALGLGREPFTLNKSHLKGIEFDLLKRIFDEQSITISESKNLPLAMLGQALKNDPQLDAVVTVKKRQDGYFYSDDFIQFNNVVVSLASSHFKFEKLNDLANKKVMAFTGAFQHLGSDYMTVFSASNTQGLYQEITNQEQQINALISGEVDAIIIDKTILRWLTVERGYTTLDAFQVDDLLTYNTNEFQVAFRNRELRNTFNSGLANLKQSGEYQHIIDDYSHGVVTPKLALTSLTSSLLAPFVYKEDHKAIGQITHKLGLLPYINKIEVYDNDDVLIHQSSNDKFNYYTQFDSFGLLENVTKKVGFVRVFFNDNQVKKQLTRSNLIPDVDIFKQHPNQQYIHDTYQRFGYLEQKIEFNLKERIYLSKPPILSYSEVTWTPLVIVENGHFSGLTADYMNIVAEKTGIKFEYKKYDKWREVVSAFKNNEIDFIPGVSNLDEYKTMGLLSDQYAYFNFAIVMDGQSSFVSDRDDLKDMRIAIPKGNSSYYYVKQHYPTAQIIEAKSINDALTMVRNGNVDAFVEHLAVATNQLENDFSDLRIVGLLDYGFSHRMLVKQGEPILLSIINKVIAAIPLAQHQEIHDRWIKREVKTAVDYRLLYQLIAGFLFILALIFLVFKKLSTAKKEVELAHQELEQSFDNLQQAQQHLVESEKMASLGALVAGIAHEINTPVGIGLTAITNFVDITQSLDKKYQLKKMSQSDFETYLKSSLESARIINRNLEKTADLVRSFKQISVDQSSDEQRSFNVKSYIDEIRLSIFHLTKKTNLTIKVECDESLEITSYPGALSQILSNFLINSTIHGYPKQETGIILIRVEVIKQTIKLTYNDDGAGISPGNISKIFNPFFTTNRESGGSGLGLNIIYNIVTNRLNGKIECASELGQYTTFVVKFKPESIISNNALD
ncbi:MAG: transporter substrate-binding domain-containing protein [Gammaproteobacteria bacterium]|nr:transporter substrate-binding domain-containing protein [Gammaproteobacteria bacterium]